MTPASEMDPDALLARTPDTTMSPYEGLTKREAGEWVMGGNKAS